MEPDEVAGSSPGLPFCQLYYSFRFVWRVPFDNKLGPTRQQGVSHMGGSTRQQCVPHGGFHRSIGWGPKYHVPLVSRVSSTWQVPYVVPSISGRFKLIHGCEIC